MITGALMSSANLISRPKLFNEDDTQTESSNAAGVVNTNSRDKDSNNNNSAINEANGRSAALERAYVHEVYENCEEPVGSIRPRVAGFLSALDPGSVVCDVGCGNGRYLTANCNPSIATIGVDRCFRLANVARDSGGEVAICDNLELPFRDDSFDAVLSLAVIHHFATTERRVSAIRELARILRIGGRVVISVWAVEQKSRRFESQDVLIPWQSPKSRNPVTSDDEDDDDDFLPPYNAYTFNEDSIHSNSSRSQGDGDSSSLSSSSPSDTCYSFVRRALQKLAGGKNPWFLDSWNSKDTKNDSSLDYEDAKDLPIELRRLEDFDDIPEPLSSAGLKSRSLGSILNPPPKQIVRSRSSVPSLGADMKQSQASESQNVTSSVLATSAQSSTVGTPSTDRRRPKLIKQKQSITDEPDFPFDDPQNPYRNMTTTHNDLRAQLLRKQSSLNEELMAESRIREKERIRKKIHKQMSLNESFLCRSVFTKRLQVIREGFTTKIKTSTGSLERVTKSGIVKIMQNIKNASTTNQCPTNPDTSSKTDASRSKPISRRLSSTGNSLERSTSMTEEERLRRHSRESGSDSSKDSSLQSDTSIESEDSFASVIFIPKKPDSSTNNTTSTSQSNKNMPSVPTSPLVMPCPTPINSPAPLQQQQKHRQVKETTRFNFDNPVMVEPNKLSTMVKMSGGEMKPRISTIITPPSPAAFTIPDSPNPQQIKSTLKHLQPRITRQTIQNLPPIPKFKKSFPIVRRLNSSSKSNVIVPKLASLEIFNPETDDLDSDLDSSEPSSPDSIDSVINALQPQSSNSPTEPLLPEISSTPSQETISSGDAKTAVTPNVKDESVVVMDKDNAIIINQNDINLNVKLTSAHNGLHTTNSLKHDCGDITSDNLDNCREHLVEFAEKLSAQLLKELDESEENGESFDDDPYLKKLSGDIKNLNILRDELRDRRLMLANLGSDQSREYPPSPPMTIQEQEEDDSPPLSAKIQSHLSQNPSLINIGTAQPSTTTKKQQQKINDSILEENEDTFEDEDSSARSRISFSNINYNPNNNNLGSTNETTLLLQEDSFDETESASLPGLQQMKQNLLKNFKQSIKLSDSNNNSNNNSCESWANSNSTSASLDSPSVGGGSATHHRYYHVFREGELDALINKHVSNLHIVSSYYERASWCVVCEKVQVWTI